MAKLTKHRIAELEKLGMVWDTYDDAWIKGYARAKAYFEEHGDLNVPVRYMMEDGYALGGWVAKQRSARDGKFQNRLLSEEQIRQLDAIGMVWGKSRDERWNDFYSEAKAYYLKNGNLEIPTQYKTHDGVCLGMWVYDQRRNWKRGKMGNPERIARLVEIGMFENEEDLDAKKTNW